ncbi:6991_t:CDS:10 [Entrophospora sp. SA101]|nr:3073_t:CDS:10 [Entrophospora sp. SA101]CAJ0833505.1 6991_t:CDS:10 [Entrophospora sp. SA101]
MSTSVTEDYSKIKSFAIFPPIGVARVGNSTDYYVGAEISGVYVGEGDTFFKFKDENNRVRPQAARFRIYGYDESGVVREIKLTDENENVKVKIVWTVTLANKKAAHTRFSGIKKYKIDNIKRNPNWEHDRSALIVTKTQDLSSDDENKEKDFEGIIYKTNEHPGHKLELGKMIMEKEGSLLIIGGKGKSGRVKKDALITEYANNDYWYDDTSDGSIDATVTITINGNEKTLKNKESKSWVLVAPPKYAPGIPNLVSLYQVIKETQGLIPMNTSNVEYYRDIRPIFDTIHKNSWVNLMAFNGHGLNSKGNFLRPELEKRLKDNTEQEEGLRKSIFSRVRKPDGIVNPFEKNGQAYEYFMPPLSGNSGDVVPSLPDTFLTVTAGQYRLLEKWARGDFEVNESNEPTKYDYQFLREGTGRYPKYRKESNGAPEYKEFEEVITDVSDQVKNLRKAPLEWCVGGPFYPGIEMTFVAYYSYTFSSKYEFRINESIEPGDINAYMALPWQADFYECRDHWWPAQRPDVVIPQEILMKEIMGKEDKITSKHFQEWTRGFRVNETNDDEPKWGDMDMVKAWDRQADMLGFVIEEKINENTKIFHEVERGKIYNDTSEGDIVTNITTDDLYDLLQIALEIELTTIPPYLYAMYSIKPGEDPNDMCITSNHVIKLIRQVAAEEMLHVSLVANLIVAIGDKYKPIFYSQEAIPSYPNPLPHVSQGEVMVNLSKADETNIETFINIEKPDELLMKHSKPIFHKLMKLRTSPLAGNVVADEVSVGSIGELYDIIERCFEKLAGEIKYKTTFQLEAGMGYAPSTGTGNDGIIVIENLADAKKAIELIKVQGEGSQTEDEASHYKKFQVCLKLIQKSCEKDYQLWPVIDNPDRSTYNDKPDIKRVATAFDASYSYLMLLLENVWKIGGQDKNNFVMGGLPALMHGVLKPIAIYLAATFDYYNFTRGDPSNTPKNQLIGVVDAAGFGKAELEKYGLKHVLDVVKSLPEIE